MKRQNWSADDRAYIIDRDNRRCHLCGKRVPPGVVLHIDHIVPLAAGGEHSRANGAVSCAPCNFRKGARAANDQLRIFG